MTTSTVPMDTPVGLLVLEGSEDTLTGIRLPNDPKQSGDDRPRATRVLEQAVSELEEYFAGERTEFDVPMAFVGTEFQRRVWAELCRIPYGETISYGELAYRVGRPKGPRAVGQANGKNPIPIIVPCHRVVASVGIGGYGGGLPMKRALLAVEGIVP